MQKLLRAKLIKANHGVVFHLKPGELFVRALNRKTEHNK